MWAWDNEEDSTYTNGSSQYLLLTSALAKAQRHVPMFYVGGPGLPASVFERGRNLNYTTFAHLTYLNLAVARFRGDKVSVELSTCERFPDISGLAALLSSATSLVDLLIDLPQNDSEAPLFYSYKELFPSDVVWYNLDSLRLQHFTISAHDVMHLVTRRMPKIGLLEIDEIVLERGRWESVFHALRELPNPPAVEFLEYDDTFLWHCGFDMCLEDYDRAVIYPKIETYIKHGRRHPCLPDGEPDSAAEYLFHVSSEDFGFMVL